jgi:hypothetical protein
VREIIDPPSQWRITPSALALRATVDGSNPPYALGLQDSVLGGQIFIPCRQLLVDCSGDVGQDARPIHAVSVMLSVIASEKT